MIDLRFLPTRAEFERARSTPRAYVVVDGRGLRWAPRPVTSPPRPRPRATGKWLRMAEHYWHWLDRSPAATRRSCEAVTEAEPPTVRRWSSEAVAERIIADAVGRSP